MKTNNTMPVVLSFVLCWLFMYVYQDAGRGIKVWISCNGWISSPVLESGQLFWQSKFILAHRNVDLHYAITMLLAQEDRSCLSKLPSCLISLWFKYQTFQVLKVKQSQPQSPRRCVILKGLFITRVTSSFFPSVGSVKNWTVAAGAIYRPSLCRKLSTQLPCATFLSS